MLYLLLTYYETNELLSKNIIDVKLVVHVS